MNMHAISSKPNNSIFYRPAVFYTVMLCLLLPIGLLAILGARNERPSRLFYWKALTRQPPRLLAFESGPTMGKLYCIDLKNGSLTTRSIARISSLRSISSFNTQVWFYHFKQKTGGVLQWMDMQSTNSGQIQERLFTNEDVWKSTVVMVDNHAVQLRSDRLEVTDFRSRIKSDDVPCPISGLLELEHIKDTNNLFLNESRIEPIRQRFLYTVSDGKLIQTANWTDRDHQQFSFDSRPYILSLLDDGLSLEVRSALSGEVVSKYTIPQTSKFPTTMTNINSLSFEESWIRWRNDPSLFTDALTGKSLPVPTGYELVQRDIAGNRLITTRTRTTATLYLDWDCLVVDATTGEELCKFQVPFDSNRIFGLAGFLIDPNQMVFATHECRFYTYDLSDGKFIHSFDPIFWFDWYSRLAAIGFAIWCGVWLRACAKLHPYGWVDLAICSGLVVAFCVYQLLNVPEPSFAVQVLCGIFGSWALASIAWIVFGRTRLVLRIQPLILIIAITTGIVALSTTREQSTVAPFVVGALMCVAAYLVVLLPFRFLGFRFQNESVANDLHAPENKDEGLQRPSAIALRDMFSLTMVLAVLFAVLRWLPSADWGQAKLLGQIGILASFVAIPSMLAFWTAFGRKTWILRWGLWATLLIGNEVASHSFTNFKIPWECVIPAAITTLFCFRAYRLRGWQLLRSARSKSEVPLAMPVE